MRRASALALTLTLACRPGDGADSVPAEPPPETSVQVEANPHNPLAALATVTASEAVSLSFLLDDGNETPAWQLEAEQATTIQILGLRAGREHRLTPRLFNERASWTLDEESFETEPLPDDWPQCDVVVDEAGEGIGEDEVFCTNGDAGEASLYLCFDRAGEIVWGVEHPQGEGMHAFRVLEDGSFAMASDTRSMLATASETGEPGAYWTPGWFEGRTRFAHHWIDNHEVIPLTEGAFVGAVAILTQAFEQPEGSDPVHAPGIVVMDPASGEVFWDWNAAGHDLGDGRSLDPDLPMERSGLYTVEGHWVHANALLHRVEPDGAEVFWMSMRHQDWIARIEVDTDDLGWRLGREGDFELAEGGAWFFQAHAPEWIEHDGDRSRFLLFDNGIVRDGHEGEPYSRLVEYTVDTATMRVEQGFSYGSDDPASGDWFYSSGTGDVDMAPDGTRIHFVKGYDENEPPFVAEVGYPEGDLRWKLSCTDQTELYRVNWAPSLYELDWRFDGS